MTALSAEHVVYATQASVTDQARGVRAEALTKAYPVPTSFFAPRRSPERRTMLAVDRVSLQLHEGEVFGLVGPNGAGKTTLIKMLTTLLLPTAGRAWIAGHDTVRSGRRVRGLVGLITSNERSFYWRLTGRRNLEFFARLYQLPRAEVRRRIDELLDAVGLRDAADQRFDGYSTGMKQRLALARGLLHRPPFLFMDEPTKGVDPIGAAEIVQLIRGPILTTWKPTILITSHNLHEIERLCGRVALMNHGRIISCGALHELRRLLQPRAVYRLAIRKVDAGTLTRLARLAGAAEAPVVQAAGGRLELEVAFEAGTDGFARLVRGLIETGGEVRDCASTPETFDDVFQTLIAQAGVAGNGPA